jgi:hypothetical protein
MTANDEDYAIVIGINTYPNLRSLKAALSDAVRFTEWLLDADGGGLPVRNVVQISGPDSLPPNPSSIRPIQVEIDNALIQFGVMRNERIGRRLYFYFAGHGLGPSFDEVAMLMAPAGIRRLGQNIGLRHYRSYFHAHAVFDEVIFILDCCRDRSQNTETRAQDFSNFGDGPARPVGDLTIMAAAYGEKAFEPVDGAGADAEPRGLLTKALLEGLRSAEAADGLGRITSRSLAAYLEREVPRMAADARLTQKPEVDSLREEIIFSVRTGDTTVRIVARTAFPGDIELLDHNMRVLDRRPAAEVTKAKPAWEVKLDSTRWYAVRRSSDPTDLPPTPFRPKKLKDSVLTVRAA